MFRYEGVDLEDGYVFVVVDWYCENCNILLLFDVLDIFKGLLVEVKLLFKLMDGLYGSWVDGKEVDVVKEVSVG